MKRRKRKKDEKERREKRGEKGRKMKRKEEKREKNPDKNNIYRLSDIICPLDAKTLRRDGIVD